MSAAAAVTDEALDAALGTSEPGWDPLEPLAPQSMRSFVSGDPSGQRLRVRYFRRGDDGALVGRVWFGPDAQGPPGHAHGGSMAAVLDEAMGAGAWLAGHTVVAARIGVSFRAMLPLGTIALVETWVESVDGRKVTTRGRLSGPGGDVFAESDGLFVAIALEKFGGFVGHAGALAGLGRSNGAP